VETEMKATEMERTSAHLSDENDHRHSLADIPISAPSQSIEPGALESQAGRRAETPEVIVERYIIPLVGNHVASAPTVVQATEMEGTRVHSDDENDPGHSSTLDRAVPIDTFEGKTGDDGA
jgi:hypothetical protein